MGTWAIRLRMMMYVSSTDTTDTYICVYIRQSICIDIGKVLEYGSMNTYCSLSFLSFLPITKLCLLSVCGLEGCKKQ